MIVSQTLPNNSDLNPQLLENSHISNQNKITFVFWNRVKRITQDEEKEL